MPFCKIRGVNLYFDEAGTGEPLLFLHGLGSSSEDWEYQVPYFAKKFKVITIDFRGFGKSDKPDSGYSIPEFAQDVIDFLNLQKIEQVTLVGVSMGGMVALECAAEFPNRIKSIVAVNALPEVKLTSWITFLKFWQRIGIISLMGMENFGKFLSKKLFPKIEQEALRQKLCTRFINNNKDVYLHTMKSFVDWSILSRLKNITCPALIIGGDRDYTTPEFKARYASLIPLGKYITIPDSGHATPVDQPDLFNQTIEGHLPYLGELSNENL